MSEEEGEERRRGAIGSSSASASSSSWDDDDDHQDDVSSVPSAQNFSFHSQQAAAQQQEEAEQQSSVPADQERQILLLMLLAQVCALHDPTPRTFTVHVLELFERGLLDRQSLHFLFDLGLVPRQTPPLLMAPPTQPQEQLALISSPSKPTTTGRNQQPHFHRERSAEVSAIRSTLAEEEQRRLLLRNIKTRSAASSANNNSNTASPSASPSNKNIAAPVSFAAEHHPLSLSRYQREFDQVRLLNSGAFGHVYQATNKMDGRDYAIKRVPFAASGFARDSVQQVVREVHCLAVCDHPHVVRYYTSWLEPSWMTGSGATTSTVDQTKLLTDLQRHVQKKGKKEDSDDLMQSYFQQEPSLSSRHRRFSVGDSLDLDESSWGQHHEDEDVSTWTMEEQHRSKDDLYIETRWQQPLYEKKGMAQAAPKHDADVWNAREPRRRPPTKPVYRYQICLFIQMQLCHPATLADWIRERNRSQTTTIQTRLQPATTIFRQVVSGLAHVHRKGIIHRDLKPANIFAAHDDAVQFKIGDFGLSKLISSIGGGTASSSNTHRSSWQSSSSSPNQQRLLFESESKTGIHSNESDDDDEEQRWHDPHTAGVGTASYAAPEQVALRSYGEKADIFSLGLILLELLCSFSTEHERLQTFHDCRHRRSLPDEFTEYPLVTRTILSCTEANAQRRPSAEELQQVDLLRSDNGLKGGDDDSTCPQSSEIEELRAQLSDKDRKLDQYQYDLAEKDRTIEELRREIDRLQRTSGGAQHVHYAFSTASSSSPLNHRGEDVAELASSASSSNTSSEDEL